MRVVINKKVWLKFLKGLLVFTVLSITFVLAVMPIWLNGIRGGYDPNFHMGRILAVADGIRAGHFPNPIGYRYLDGLGYGVGFFYGNFWLYPFAFFVAHGAAVAQVYTVLLCVLVIGAMVTIGLTALVITKNIGMFASKSVTAPWISHHLWTFSAASQVTGRLFMIRAKDIVSIQKRLIADFATQTATSCEISEV